MNFHKYDRNKADSRSLWAALGGLCALLPFGFLGCQSRTLAGDRPALRAAVAEISSAQAPFNRDPSAQTDGDLAPLRIDPQRGLVRFAGRRVQLISRLSAVVDQDGPQGALSVSRVDRYAAVFEANDRFALHHALTWQDATEPPVAAHRTCWGDTQRWWITENGALIEAIDPLRAEQYGCVEALFSAFAAPLSGVAWDDPVAPVERMTFQAGDAGFEAWRPDRAGVRLRFSARPRPAAEGPAADALRPPADGLAARALWAQVQRSMLQVELWTAEDERSLLAARLHRVASWAGEGPPVRVDWRVDFYSEGGAAPVVFPQEAQKTPDRARIEADLRHILHRSAEPASEEPVLEQPAPAPLSHERLDEGGAQSLYTAAKVGPGAPALAGQADGALPVEPQATWPVLAPLPPEFELNVPFRPAKADHEPE